MNKTEILEASFKYLTQEKKDKIERVLQYRTQYITVVLEDIYQSHNSSAVIRSCEAFGIQDIFVIENKHKFSINKDVDKGGAKWTSIKLYKEKNANNTKHCFDDLRKLGYKIVATTPHEQCISIDELSLDSKIALVFGTEQQGLSEFALNNADCYVKIPMVGFTQSFNISVAAAICLYELTNRLRSSNIDWCLTREQIDNLKLEWAGKSSNLYKKNKKFFSTLIL